MTLTHDDLRPLLGARVRVDLTPAANPCLMPDPDAVLRYLPPGAAVFAQRGTGVEHRVPLHDLESVADARSECQRCHAVVNNTFDVYAQHFNTADIPPGTPSTLCADCYRPVAQSLPAPVMECPECGAVPAFYSPGDFTFACATCHGKRKGLTGLGVELRVLAATPIADSVRAADCRGADLDDSRHRWQNVKGHRYHCTLCFAKRFTDPDVRTLA